MSQQGWFSLGKPHRARDKTTYDGVKTAGRGFLVKK